jgi:hypothetical protein
MSEETGGELVVPQASDVTVFNPTETTDKLAQLDGNILTLRKLKDWPALEAAVDAKIAEQTSFVTWWDSGPGKLKRRKGVATVTDPMTVAEAETRTGVRKQTVSKWRVALKDLPKYRRQIFAGAYQVVFPEPKDPAAVKQQPERDGPDFWPTPKSLVDACVNYVLPMLPHDPIWECAAGDGRLANAIATVGREVWVTDRYAHPGHPGLELMDFLDDDPPMVKSCVVTNPPFNQADAFIERGLQLMDEHMISAVALLLRHDHLQAASRVAAFNRATWEVHCNWRPVWIEGTGNEAAPRWSFHWIVWRADSPRRPPLYLG